MKGTAHTSSVLRVPVLGIGVISDSCCRFSLASDFTPPEPARNSEVDRGRWAADA